MRTMEREKSRGALHDQVRALVHDSALHDKLNFPASLLARVRALLPDIQYFWSQQHELALRDRLQPIAHLKDGETGEDCQTVVRIPDLHNLKESLDRFIRALHTSKIELEGIAPFDAEEAFITSITDYLDVDANLPGETTVHSRRKGDIIVYAQGYFLSTGTAFGLSTPATHILAPGRYSFGIVENGMPAYDNLVWHCPGIVHLQKP